MSWAADESAELPYRYSRQVAEPEGFTVPETLGSGLYRDAPFPSLNRLTILTMALIIETNLKDLKKMSTLKRGPNEHKEWLPCNLHVHVHVEREERETD